MSSITNDSEMALCVVAHGQYKEIEVAEMAAADRATGKVIRFAVKDSHSPEIVIGHMVVAVFCGCEKAIDQVMESLNSIEGATRRE